MTVESFADQTEYPLRKFNWKSSDSIYYTFSIETKGAVEFSSGNYEKFWLKFRYSTIATKSKLKEFTNFMAAFKDIVRDL